MKEKQNDKTFNSICQIHWGYWGDILGNTYDLSILFVRFAKANWPLLATLQANLSILFVRFATQQNTPMFSSMPFNSICQIPHKKRVTTSFYISDFQFYLLDSRLQSISYLDRKILFQFYLLDSGNTPVVKLYNQVLSILFVRFFM